MSIAIKSTRAQILATGNAFTGNGLVQLYVDENNDIVFIVTETIAEVETRVLKTVVQSDEMILELTQADTDAPTVVINSNTTDISDEDVVPAYVGVGDYTLGFPVGSFTDKILAILPGNNFSDPAIISASKLDDQTISVKTYDVTGVAYANGLLSSTSLSIAIFDAVV